MEQYEKFDYHNLKKKNKKNKKNIDKIIKRKKKKIKKNKKLQEELDVIIKEHNHIYSKPITVMNEQYPNIKPRNESQKIYFSYLKNPNINLVFAVGSAGTGKTILACEMGISYMKSGKINKIIITRPTVSADEDIGFLPGTLEEKMAPWLVPIFDIFNEYFSADEVKRMCDNKVIEISPLAYMRGRTLKNAWIIADEMQNTTVNQMKMILTRIGENSKLVLTGDPKQFDRLKHRYEINGLQDFMNRYEKIVNKSNKIKIVHFTKKDVERSQIVKEILDIYGE